MLKGGHYTGHSRIVVPLKQYLMEWVRKDSSLCPARGHMEIEIRKLDADPIKGRSVAYYLQLRSFKGAPVNVLWH